MLKSTSVILVILGILLLAGCSGGITTRLPNQLLGTTDFELQLGYSWNGGASKLMMDREEMKVLTQNPDETHTITVNPTEKDIQGILRIIDERDIMSLEDSDHEASFDDVELRVRIGSDLAHIVCDECSPQLLGTFDVIKAFIEKGVHRACVSDGECKDTRCSEIDLKAGLEHEWEADCQHGNCGC